jgi:hypothetical protein
MIVLDIILLIIVVIILMLMWYVRQQYIIIHNYLKELEKYHENSILNIKFMINKIEQKKIT